MAKKVITHAEAVEQSLFHLELALAGNGFDSGNVRHMQAAQVYATLATSLDSKGK